MASLEALPPEDMETHGQMNRAWFTTYLLLREETVRNCEARGVVHEKLGSLGAHRGDGYNRVDDGSFGQKGNTGGNGSKCGDGDQKSEKERTAECYISQARPQQPQLLFATKERQMTQGRQSQRQEERQQARPGRRRQGQRQRQEEILGE